MKQVTACSLGLLALASVALAGTEYSGREMKQTVTQAAQECWYGDREFNVSLWGAYAFSGTENQRAGIEDAADFAV